MGRRFAQFLKTEVSFWRGLRAGRVRGVMWWWWWWRSQQVGRRGRQGGVGGSTVGDNRQRSFHIRSDDAHWNSSVSLCRGGGGGFSR